MRSLVLFFEVIGMNGRLPGIRALRTLEAACRHLNFSKAAVELGLTPAAVSHQVKEFEDQIGVALFRRSGRIVSLTPAGDIMHAAAREAVDGLTRALAEARRAGQTQRLEIFSINTVASKWLLPRIDKFTQKHPSAEIKLHISDHIRDDARDSSDILFWWGVGDYVGKKSIGCSNTPSIPFAVRNSSKYGAGRSSRATCWSAGSSRCASGPATAWSGPTGARGLPQPL